MDIETIIISVVIYIFLVITITKLGTYKSCGGKKAFFVSLVLTPIVGIIYTSVSPIKNVLKITHYRCRHCGLEYTTSHKYCPSCLKDGKKYHLQKFSMRTY
jgi:ribosomal protein L37E